MSSAETLKPNQLLSTIKETKTSPLPSISSQNASLIEQAFNTRLELLELIDNFSLLSPKQLSDKSPREVLIAEDQLPKAARAIYEVLTIASFPSEETGLPKRKEDLQEMISHIPPLLSKLGLGEELIKLLKPSYQQDIIPPPDADEQALQTRYGEITTRLNQVSSQDALASKQRFQVTKDVLALLVLVSHPQTKKIVKDADVPPAKKGALPEKLSSIAASYLTHFSLGPELYELIKTEGERKEPQTDWRRQIEAMLDTL